MKKQVVNVSISILFSITIVLTIVSLTVLNDRFVMKVLDHNNYIFVIQEKINEDFKKNNIDRVIEKEEVKGYVKAYVKSRYKYEEKNYSSAMESKIINEHILFMGNKDYKFYSYIIYLLTLISIIITGNVFLKSKKYHDLANVYIYSFFILVFIYGIGYFNVDKFTLIVKEIVDLLNHIILGVGIVLLEIGLIKKQIIKKFNK